MFDMICRNKMDIKRNALLVAMLTFLTSAEAVCPDGKRSKREIVAFARKLHEGIV